MSPSLAEVARLLAAPWHRDGYTLNAGPGGLVLSRKGLHVATFEADWPKRRPPEDEVLAAALEGIMARIPRHAALTVRIFDGWSRLSVVQWPAGLHGRSERKAYLQMAFADSFGVGPWRIVSADATPRMPVVACAIAESLLATVNDACRARSVALRSLRPRWFDAVELCGHACRSGRGGLLVFDSGVATLGYWDDGAWRGIRTQFAGMALHEGWASLSHALLPAREIDAPAIVHCVGRVPPAGLMLPAGWAAQVHAEGRA